MLHSLFTARDKLTTLLYTFTHTAVIKHFFIYSFGSFFMRSIAMLLVPLNMRILSPADYGTLSLITMFITITTALIGLGLRQVLSLEFFHHDIMGRKRIITEIIIIYTAFALPSMLLIWHLRTTIIMTFFFNSISIAQLAPALLTIFFFFYAELLYQLLQYEQKAALLTALQVILALLTACITIVALWVFHVGLVGIIWAQAISTLVAAGIFVFMFMKRYGIGSSIYAIQFHHAYHYVRNGLPFIPGIMCSWMLSSADRWILASYRSMHEVGIYAIADMVSQLFYALVLIPWSGAYLPYIMKRYAQGKNNLAVVEQKNRQTMWITMIGVTSIMVLGFFAGRPLLYTILPPSYYAAISYMLMLLLGQTFLLGSYFASSLIQFHKKSLFLAGALFIPATLNVLMNMLLVPSFGILGCSVATLISYGIYFMITYFYNKTLA